MAGRAVRSWPVRVVPRGSPEDVALARQVAATVGRVRAREVLDEQQQRHTGPLQPSLFGRWADPWTGRAA